MTSTYVAVELLYLLEYRKNYLGFCGLFPPPPLFDYTLIHMCNKCLLRFSHLQTLPLSLVLSLRKAFFWHSPLWLYHSVHCDSNVPQFSVQQRWCTHPRWRETNSPAVSWQNGRLVVRLPLSSSDTGPRWPDWGYRRLMPQRWSLRRGQRICIRWTFTCKEWKAKPFK